MASDHVPSKAARGALRVIRVFVAKSLLRRRTGTPHVVPLEVHVELATPGNARRCEASVIPSFFEVIRIGQHPDRR
jgi:hypothetical protein